MSQGVEQLQAQLEKKKRHQEFHLLMARNDERITAHNVIVQEATTGIDTLDGCCDTMEVRLKTAASRQEHLFVESLSTIAVVLAYTCDLN